MAEIAAGAEARIDLPARRPELALCGQLVRLEGFFRALRRRHVRCVVTGGFAAVLHGIPRATKDLDLLIEPTEQNARALLDAFVDDGLIVAALASAQGLAASELTVIFHVMQVDVETFTPGLDFGETWGRRHTMRYRDADFDFITIEDLIANKLATHRPERPIHEADLRYLGAWPEDSTRIS